MGRFGGAGIGFGVFDFTRGVLVDPELGGVVWFRVWFGLVFRHVVRPTA